MLPYSKEPATSGLFFGKALFWQGAFLGRRFFGKALGATKVAAFKTQ